MQATRFSPSGPAGRQTGFTYIGLLLLIAFLGVSLAATGVVWSKVQQRQKERQLLFAGNQFREAIGRYYLNTPGTVKQYPQNIEDLLADPRQLTKQRYLRRIYRDPMTGKADWALIKAPSGRIIGVHSLASGRPIKQGNFRYRDQSFAGKSQYSEWWFIYMPANVSSQIDAPQ